MAEFFFEYGLFALKALTVVVAIGAVIVIAVSAGMRTKKPAEGHLEITKVNDQLDDMRDMINAAVTDPDAFKIEAKKKKKADKAERKAHKKALKKGGHSNAEDGSKTDEKARAFVLDFDGDMKAAAVSGLRREITAVLSMAAEDDEVILRLESGGGMVHAYGLASSQLQRIKDRKIPLTVCVDKVAASGGYMMACVADKLLAAPFAIIGSIGVIAQLPNFHRLLKKHDVDFEMITAGEYKRTLTMFGENTEKGREKFVEDVEDIHLLFKDFVTQHRPQLDIEKVATGEAWFGQRALDRVLVDSLMTSDEYIANACEERNVFEVKYVEKKSLPEKFGIALHSAIDTVLLKWWDRGSKGRYL